MGYCTAADVRQMIKDDALNVIIGDAYIDDDLEQETKITLLIDEAIKDASDEIDGYLGKRYPIPLSIVPGSISKFAKDIAVYNLFSRMGIDEDSREKNYLTRYKAAIQFLTLLAEGKVDIGVTNTQVAAQAGFKMQSSPRLFSRDSMRGM